MNVTVTWGGGLYFSGETESGFRLPLSNPTELTSNHGLSPMELLLLGLAGCTAMDVISILRKKRQEVTEFEIRVQAEQSFDHPRVFTEARIEYIITGRDVDEAAVARSIELSETKYCPVIAMFGKVMPIRLSYRIENPGNDTRRPKNLR